MSTSFSNPSTSDLESISSSSSTNSLASIDSLVLERCEKTLMNEVSTNVSEEMDTPMTTTPVTDTLMTTVSSDTSEHEKYLNTPLPSDASDTSDTSDTSTDTSDTDTSSNNLPAPPPPSWTNSIEAFINQLNDFEYSYDSESEAFELLEFNGTNETEVISPESDNEHEGDELNFNDLNKNNWLLAYLAVPILLSHILMILVISQTSNLNVNGNSVFPIVKPIIYSIHHHHHHNHNHHHYYYYTEEKNSDGSYTKRFLHIFFNPFSIMFNSKYYKSFIDWFTKQINDPTTHFGYYLNTIHSKLNTLRSVMTSGLENEIGKGLKVRDELSKVIYDKIYKIAETPQYKQIVSTASKWASAIKDRFWSG